jgi:hypothetical protein
MKPNQKDGEEVELSVSEFMRIFKPDKFSDYFMNVVTRELKNRALADSKKTPKNKTKLSPIRANSMKFIPMTPKFS